jgi:hypothetical protein
MGGGEVMSTTDRLQRATDGSEALERGIRVGLLAYGLTHVVIAATALPLAWGDRAEGSASQQGAFAQMAGQPLGGVLLTVVSAGLVCLVVWQLVEALTGHREEQGKKRTLERVGSFGRAVVYGVLAWMAANTAWGSSGSGGSGSSPDGISARLMSAPGGTLLVGALGAGIVGVAGYLVFEGWAERFTRHLDTRSRGGSRTPAVVLGKVGYIAKGAALGVVGALFLTAAVQHDPKESGGLDVALHELLRQPLGPVLLAVVALGLGCFGLYCFLWARHLRR